MENLRNKIDIRLLNNKKFYLKWTWKPSYLAQKIFDNDLVALHKINTTLALKQPVNVGMCIVEFSKSPTHEFHYYYT